MDDRYDPPVEWFEGELYHHGILGQKWGVRRYQNKDGSLTQQGKQRYSKMQAIGNKGSSMVSRSKKKIKDAKESVDNYQKESLMKSGNRKRIYKNRNKFTNEEIDTMTNRFKKEDELGRLAGYDSYGSSNNQPKKVLSVPKILAGSAAVVDHIIYGHNTLMKLGVMTDVIIRGIKPGDSRYGSRMIDYVKKPGDGKKKK